MPVTGRKPKPAGQTVHRNKPQSEWTEVVNTPYTKAPTLPRVRPDGRPWPAWTKRKWKAWSSMPHCVLWTEATWDYAFDALELHVRFCEGSTPAATELRNREKVLGTTPDYLRDLRIRYVDAPKVESSDNVTSMDDYRDL